MVVKQDLYLLLYNENTNLYNLKFIKQAYLYNEKTAYYFDKSCHVWRLVDIDTYSIIKTSKNKSNIIQIAKDNEKEINKYRQTNEYIYYKQQINDIFNGIKK